MRIIRGVLSAWENCATVAKRQGHELAAGSRGDIVVFHQTDGADEKCGVGALYFDEFWRPEQPE